MKKNFRILALILVALTMMVLGAGCSEQEEGVIATYEGGQVTEDEFNTYLGVRQFFNSQITDYLSDEEVRDDLLEQLISEEYLSAKVENKDQFNDDAESVMTMYRDYLVQQTGEDGYKKILTDLNITEEDLTEYIINYFAVEDYFVNKRYNENKEDFTVATVSHILITTEERTDEEAQKLAQDVLDQLKGGADFGELAKQYSEDPGSKDNGGTYEDVSVALWVPEFKEASLTLPINEISDLVKTDYGYHIITVSDRYVPEIEAISPEDRERAYSEEYTNFLTNELPSLIKDKK